MPTIISPATSPRVEVGVAQARSVAVNKIDGGAQPSGQGGAAAPEVSISTLASRLSRAERLNALPYDQMKEEVLSNPEKIAYQATDPYPARMVKELQEPKDASSAPIYVTKVYIENWGAPNPFAGLSRAQLWIIASDRSSTFTTNEKEAARWQAIDDEKKWRADALARAVDEYLSTGKLTNFFKSCLAHFNELPSSEQALYPENYAADLQDKIDRDFNYFTDMPHGLPGKAEVSLEHLDPGTGFDIAEFLKHLPYPGPSLRQVVPC